uniref:Uncharacterized protein n=1 Tax=viral metagenome TaxID=1070528 RepID=A0A6C0HL73_9ZZZZ
MSRIESETESETESMYVSRLANDSQTDYDSQDDNNQISNNQISNSTIIYDLQDATDNTIISNASQHSKIKVNISRKQQDNLQLDSTVTTLSSPNNTAKTLKKQSKTDAKAAELETLLYPNAETIEYFTKGLDPIKILTKKSHIENDTILLCLLLKSNKIKTSDYKCSKRQCKIKKAWNGKEIQLLIKRKNGVISDLTPTNLELLCPNCYMQDAGLELFKKQIARTEFLCKYCKFTLVNFSNSRKKGGVCLACEKRLINMSAENNEIEYDNQYKSLYKDNTYLNDDLKKTNYYSEVSRYKNFSKTQLPKAGNLNSIKPSAKSIVINCNMDIGNIDELNDMIHVDNSVDCNDE